MSSQRSAPRSTTTAYSRVITSKRRKTSGFETSFLQSIGAAIRDGIIDRDTIISYLDKIPDSRQSPVIGPSVDETPPPRFIGGTLENIIDIPLADKSTWENADKGLTSSDSELDEGPAEVDAMDIDQQPKSLFGDDTDNDSLQSDGGDPELEDQGMKDVTPETILEVDGGVVHVAGKQVAEGRATESPGGSHTNVAIGPSTIEHPYLDTHGSVKESDQAGDGKSGDGPEVKDGADEGVAGGGSGRSGEGSKVVDVGPRCMSDVGNAEDEPKSDHGGERRGGEGIEEAGGCGGGGGGESDREGERDDEDDDIQRRPTRKRFPLVISDDTDGDMSETDDEPRRQGVHALEDTYDPFDDDGSADDMDTIDIEPWEEDEDVQYIGSRSIFQLPISTFPLIPPDVQTLSPELLSSLRDTM